MKNLSKIIVVILFIVVTIMFILCINLQKEIWNNQETIKHYQEDQQRQAREIFNLTVEIQELKKSNNNI
ncbi:MAG: hypothetical protein IKL55_04225 [Clostridia bacterium]|nr:hypothetical protein [Clostridia bacterium]